jgi:hypothetical protein
MEKPKNKVKLNKIKKKPSNIDPKDVIFTMGVLDLTFIIEFTDRDLSRAKLERIEDINKLNQLEFLKYNEDLIRRIKLKSENEILKQLLLLNKTSEIKKRIEFFAVFRPKFRENEFFEDIFDKVTKRNGIIINKKSITKKANFSIYFELKYKATIQRFNYSEADTESDNQIENEHFDTKSGFHKKSIITNNENSENKNEEGNKLLNILKPDYKKYGLVYINVNELKNIEEYLDADEFIEVVKSFKSKGIKIFANYYKPDKSDLVEPPMDDDDVFDEEDRYNANNNNNANNENENDNENGNEDNIEEQNTPQKEQENNNKPKEETFSKQQFLKTLYDLSDIFFFDENQANKLFDNHFKTFSQKKGTNQVKKSQVHDYFISSIAGNTKGDKVGLFLKDLEYFTIVNCSNKIGNYETLDSTLYPRRTIRNIELINKYKSVIQQNKDEFYSVFCSLMIGAVSDPTKSFEQEIKVGFINALDIIKKELECSKTNIAFNEGRLINFQSLKQTSRFNRTNCSLKGKENGFVLDCMNKEKSKLKPYLSLDDKNLKWFFDSKYNWKNLVQKGFIDKKGYIMYDKEYRDIFGPEYTIKAKKRGKKNLSKVITELSLKSQILKTEPKKIIVIRSRTEKKIPK